MIADQFNVELDVYAGPLDLLLYLVRREELELVDVSLAKIADQFSSFLDVLAILDIDCVGDFIEVAAILVELKAKAVLPQNSFDQAEESNELERDDDQLVVRLIQYKRYRDASTVLEERGIDWQMRYVRQSNDLLNRNASPEDQPLERIEVWDLVSAFGRILRERQPAPTETVIYDETPMHVYMQQIHRTVLINKTVELQTLFEFGQHKSAMVGLFLATLELTRHHGLEVRQVGNDGALILVAGEKFATELQVAEVDNMLAEKFAASNIAYRPR